jgi:hypothetical protein
MHPRFRVAEHVEASASKPACRSLHVEPHPTVRQPGAPQTGWRRSPAPVAARRGAGTTRPPQPPGPAARGPAGRRRSAAGLTGRGIAATSAKGPGSVSIASGVRARSGARPAADFRPARNRASSITRSPPAMDAQAASPFASADRIAASARTPPSSAAGSGAGDRQRPAASNPGPPRPPAGPRRSRPGITGRWGRGPPPRPAAGPAGRAAPRRGPPAGAGPRPEWNR